MNEEFGWQHPSHRFLVIIPPQQSEALCRKSCVHIKRALNFANFTGADIAISAVPQLFGQSYLHFRPVFRPERGKARIKSQPWSKDDEGVVPIGAGEGNDVVAALARYSQRPVFPLLKQVWCFLANAQQVGNNMLFQPAGSPFVLLGGGRLFHLRQLLLQRVEVWRATVVWVNEAEVEAFASLIDVR